MIDCGQFFKITGIYFLWRNNKIVYIGESTCIISRVMQHKSNKKFDRFSFKIFNGSNEERREREQALIFLHKPVYNKQVGKDGNLSPKKVALNTSTEDKKKAEKLSNWDNFDKNVLPELKANYGITQYHWNSFRISKTAHLFIDYYPGKGRTFIYETKEWITLTADQLLQSIEIYLGPTI